ncbi:hypothetical protein VOLCADRAFT_108410 [Volvox carteri f. nagariensis]|uniref:Uncharacterized protein n=1 Tax=Volvox carteri f. nagariensis TaxID=3068 RepID=D8UK17_VOLCA|nr:uncharacterized protein VOLCADRAFT_108410 [Volvox carteri f. nagariensis]EFJ39928.1 hypothetical protein VOLCADRAFT_108410 [Volvox carteri f. nagariensis]|eukprot:XP_002959009.1 hypothetical protein VOLCADRAFT_108410 [Volvox carteri f. nagariensis]
MHGPGDVHDPHREHALAAPVALPLQYGGLRLFMQSNTWKWYTPDFILDLVHELFAPGCIDLDPCSCAAANTQDTAFKAYFLRDLFWEYQAGNVRQAVVLLKAGIGYSWFNDMLNWPVCFLQERLSFVRQYLPPIPHLCNPLREACG